MSYSIRYGPHRTNVETKDSPKKYYYLGILMIMIVAAFGFLWPQGVDMLRMILFPWADGPTLEAFQQMVAQVEEGVSIPDAIFVFCRQIISNADIVS